ncbi:MAG: hypothetical protein MI919_06750 [Holophagales bacterium]|nr:hypothetical protein [Holophagales bacterium]
MIAVPRHRPTVGRIAVSILLASIAILPARAEVERLEIEARQPLFDGHSFGLAGPYEQLSGTVHFAVDPEDPRNARVVDLHLARRDADGKVRFTSRFYLCQPTEPKRGRGALLVDVANRGNPLALWINYPDSTFRQPEGPYGDGFLMERGFTFGGVGWQPDVPVVGPHTLRLETPALDEAGGEPVRGLARADWIPIEDASTMPLGHWGHDAYPVADAEDPRNVLAVRDRVYGKPRVLPRSSWRFARLEGKGEVPDPTSIVLDGGFSRGRIYEAVYVAENPRLVGLGFVATREFVTFLRDAEASPANVDRTIAVGGSQTGRFLRHFVYQGFNAGRVEESTGETIRVLDGMLPFVGGAGRGSFNHRFAQPSRAMSAFLTFFYPTDMFPFTGATQTDAATGRTDGLLKRAAATGTIPKTFQVNTAWEYWGRAGSLIHTTPDGATDVALLPEERLYVFASTQHGPAQVPPPRLTELPFVAVHSVHRVNPANFSWSLRALLLALDAWIADGVEPPPSRYPRVDDGTLVRRSELRFPAIPGVEPPRVYAPHRTDYGPRFRQEGIVDHQPPKLGEPFGVRVSQVDADGNDLGGLRLPEIVVPLATHTGWNLRAASAGAEGQPADMVGAFLPFSRTRAEREAKGDPRPSIEERYESREAYLGRVAEAAMVLIEERYLLPEDLPAILAYASELWRLVETGLD